MSGVKTLGGVCEAIVDCEHKTAPVDESGDYFAVGTPAMRDGEIDYSQARRVSHTTFEAWTRRLRPQAGDLLFAREAPVGPIVRIPADENVAPGQRTVLLRPDRGQVDSNFLFYLLRSPFEQRRLQERAAGSTVAHLNVADVRAFELPTLPDLDQQCAIAEVLGALDDKIAANRKLAEKADSLASVIFDSEASGLPTVPLLDVLIPVLGATPSRSNPEFWANDLPWASVKDATRAQCGVILETDERISEHARLVTKAKPLPAHSVLLTARGTVGVVARVLEPTAFNQSCYGFEPSALPPATLYFTVLRATSRIAEFAYGSVFDSITMSTFKNFVVPDFDPATLETTEAKIGPLLAATERAARESRTLTTLRDTLLPRLMSGELRVRDAERAVEAAL